VTSEPWSRVHIDLAGPFEGFMWMIVIDWYTKWLEVTKMKSTTALSTCIKRRKIFARLGPPRTVVSDNGPQFTSDEFKHFCQSNNIQAIRSSPYNPKTNGLAERAVRTFKERMTASRDVSDIDARLQKFLL
jgi:transposase InsO family protein